MTSWLEMVQAEIRKLGMTVHRTGLASRPFYGPAMDRRRFLLTSLTGALAAPLVAEAQKAGKVPRIGFPNRNRGLPSGPMFKSI